MTSRQCDRNTPYLWDIFGKTPSDDEHQLQLSDTSSVCTNGGHDSAISVSGCPSDDEAYAQTSSTSSSNKKKKSRTSRRDTYNTEAEVKYLERHLSMKKTIRKKIMRDLQKAFVEDPNEFRVEDIPPEQLKAEINLQSLSFEPSGKKKGKKNNESNFLDFLRLGNADGKNSNNNNNNNNGKVSWNKSNRDFDDEADSGHESPTRTNSDLDEDKKTSFWRRFTIKGSRSKR